MLIGCAYGTLVGKFEIVRAREVD